MPDLAMLQLCEDDGVPVLEPVRDLLLVDSNVPLNVGDGDGVPEELKDITFDVVGEQVDDTVRDRDVLALIGLVKLEVSDSEGLALMVPEDDPVEVQLPKLWERVPVLVGVTDSLCVVECVMAMVKEGEMLAVAVGDNVPRVALDTEGLGEGVCVGEPLADLDGVPVRDGLALLDVVLDRDVDPGDADCDGVGEQVPVAVPVVALPLSVRVGEQVEVAETD